MEQKFDFLGHPLFVGDTVIYIHPSIKNGTELTKAVVTREAPRKVYVSFENRETVAYPEKLIKYKEEIQN